MISLIESNIIGRSEAISRVKTLIKINAQYPAPVLITGETGTGKELAARGLHYSGVYANKPFIAINCSTFSDELFSSELFGYKKGAFTDAKTDKEGLLIAAEGGSIFLDEIDSLSLKSQTALLRLLQESEFRPIGSSQTIKANVRIIAAANCNLAKRINEGEFRQDLYFRLFILSVNMPPLRERSEDIEPLINHFIDKLNRQYGLGRKAMDVGLTAKLKQHDWPGNVRELENMVHRYYLLSSGAVISEMSQLNTISETPAMVQYPTAMSDDEGTVLDDDIGELTGAFAGSVTGTITDIITDTMTDSATKFDFCDAKRRAIELFEQKFVAQVLHHAKGNVTKAATLCGKERRAFGKLVKKYNINRDNLRMN